MQSSSGKGREELFYREGELPIRNQRRSPVSDYRLRSRLVKLMIQRT